MPTVQEIITWVDRKYPNQETTANKILDLDDIHKEIFVKISKLNHNYEIYETSSIADQLTYSLPSDCTIDNIISVIVSTSDTITLSTEWDEFRYAGINDTITTGNWYGQGASNTMVLLKDGSAIATSGLSIRLFYYRNPTSITSVTNTPELDPYYHNLLKYALVQALASQGHNPDTQIADYWQRKHDEFLAQVGRDLADKMNKAPTQSQQVEEWW